MKFSIVNERCKCMTYASSCGATEYFFVVESDGANCTGEALRQMHADVAEALACFGLSRETTVFTRFYLSDLANQRDELLAAPVFAACSAGAHAVVEQPPLNGGKVALLMYHIKGESITCEPLRMGGDGWRSGVKVTGANYTQYWMGNATSDVAFDSYKQTQEIFRGYTDFLAERGMTLFDNALRTWIYVRDIDNHYAGMVTARRECFDENNMTKDTHYVASTGIEARLREVSSLVSMDALAIDGIRPGQVQKMAALDHLNPTHEYGVTFERGARITFGDRVHFHISGTASIDRHGQVLHLGDVEKQTYRTLENIRALLSPHGGTLDDMAFLIVYLRDQSHVTDVTQILREEVGHDIPIVAVRGAVCRPTWLVEIEGMGVKRAATAEFPPLA
jgi:enamine deaminase RidA (YjgF/YER057c/UK114 family)